jgi:hypothetical protein
MNASRNIKATHQRNITPNFLRFKRNRVIYPGKSTSKSKEEEGNEQPQPSERSNSKASRCSFDVYEKRVLHLSKLSTRCIY